MLQGSGELPLWFGKEKWELPLWFGKEKTKFSQGELRFGSIEKDDILKTYIWKKKNCACSNYTGFKIMKTSAKLITK